MFYLCICEISCNTLKHTAINVNRDPLGMVISKAGFTYGLVWATDQGPKD